MAVVELFHQTEASESYEGRREATRLRLTSEEARHIRYVLSEWAGEAMPGSSAAQLEKLAAAPVLLDGDVSESDGRRRIRLALVSAAERWRSAWLADQQTQYVNPTKSSGFHGWEMTPADMWVNDRYGAARKKRESALRAWRVLRRMADEGAPALVVLHALYGDLPPGLPMRGLWPKGVDDEYRRVVRLVDRERGSGAALDAIATSEKKRRPNESADAHRARLAAASTARTALLGELGAACEKLIVQSANAYRAAWRATP